MTARSETLERERERFRGHGIGERGVNSKVPEEPERVLKNKNYF